MAQKKSQRLATAIRWLGTILATGLFIWLVAGQRWDVVLQKAVGIAPWAVCLSLAFYVVSYFFNTLRWCLLLWAQDVKISFWQAFRLVWAGIFASNFLFSTIGGDGFRVVGLLRYTTNKTMALGSVALDRIVNVTAMACLLPLSLAMFGNLLVAPMFAFPIPEKLRQLFRRSFSKITDVLRIWAAQPGVFVQAFLATWPSNLFPMAATYLIARQLEIDVSFWQVIGVQTAAYFINQLPSINGYGLREASFVTLYSALGASIEQASTLALVTRFLSVAATLPGALWLPASVTDAVLNDDKLVDEARQP